MSGFIKLKEIWTQISDVNHAFNEQGIELYKNAECCDSRNRTRKFFTEFIAYKITFQPSFNITRGFICAPLISRTMNSERFPDGDIAFRFFLTGGSIFCLHLARSRRQLSIQIFCLYIFWMVALALQNCLDHAMRQQIWIAPYRTGEMSIGIVRQTEMPNIVRAVDRLLHGAQQHGLQHDGIGPQFYFFHQLCVVRCRWATGTTER